MKKPIFVLTVFFLGVTAFGFYTILSLKNRINKIETKLGGPRKVASDQKAVVEKVRRSVVRIIGGESSGSGFAIQKGGYILTNFHVIEFEPSPKIVLPDNTFETASVIMADKDADLAVVKINKDLPILLMADLKKLESAEELLAIGYPLSGDLPGESSVKKGLLSARRKDKTGMEYLETDMTLISGMSGGPMVNIFGEVVGINTMGLSGMGVAISADSIRKKWSQMYHSKDSLKDVQRVIFTPNKNALEAVRCFYNYLRCRNLEKAFVLLSDNFVHGYSFEHWAKGYAPLLNTTVIKIWPDEKTANRIRIKLHTRDLGEEGMVVDKLFEGYWDVRKMDGKWLLWHPKIHEVKEPDEKWFEQ